MIDLVINKKVLKKKIIAILFSFILLTASWLPAFKTLNIIIGAEIAEAIIVSNKKIEKIDDDWEHKTYNKISVKYSCNGVELINEVSLSSKLNLYNNYEPTKVFCNWKDVLFIYDMLTYIPILFFIFCLFITFWLFNNWKIWRFRVDIE